MYFSDYSRHPDAKLDPGLLWEYQVEQLDYDLMRDLIVERIVQRGRPDDWYFMLNRYGVHGVSAAVRNIAYLNDVDMNFVSKQFDIPLNDLKCYKKKQSVERHWNS